MAGVPPERFSPLKSSEKTVVSITVPFIEKGSANNKVIKENFKRILKSNLIS